MPAACVRPTTASDGGSSLDRLARDPHPCTLSAKPAGTVRIFVLGESAAMGTPDPSFNFGRILGVMLREQYPGMQFEVVNGAMTAINSYVTREIARDCAARQPDLFRRLHGKQRGDRSLRSGNRLPAMVAEPVDGSGQSLREIDAQSGSCSATSSVTSAAAKALRATGGAWRCS